ncbi:MAG: cation diffusion facilitator family transporter [Candidatus Aminicenantes bacterium]|nr:cation diffusion facilitator family transporter [Candidatus Aminicenantes bacterium]
MNLPNGESFPPSETQRHASWFKERRFVFSLVLTGLIFLIEFIGGFWTGSLALLSDSAHVFLDAFALGLSYLAIRAAALPPNDRHTYGYHRLQVLAALANGATLLLIAVEILREAWSRFRHPAPISAGPMLVIAVLGLAVNLVVALALHKHDRNDLNTRSAFLHVIGDAVASIGVIGAGLAILITGAFWLDPLVSVLIGLLILLSSGRILKQSVHVLAEGMPEGMTASGITDVLRRMAGVIAVHDLHVWRVAPGYIALSAHVVIDDQFLSRTAVIMDALKKSLDKEFNIRHVTIQFECGDCGQGGASGPQP